MPLISGVDGCPGGWLCLTADTETALWEAQIYPTAALLLAEKASSSSMAIDMPIGLPINGRRRCDELAKKRLGRRHSSVFYAPAREAADAPSRIAAGVLMKRGVSVQEWNIYPKINNLDHALSPADQEWCFEAHPEISFQHWNGGVPLLHKKSTAQGRAEREELIDGHCPGMREAARELLLRNADRSHFTTDDLNDAFACLWTARRIHDNEALQIPERPDVDARGLRMEIWF